MKLFIKILLVLCLAHIQKSFAGGTIIGDGGHIVRCKADGKNSKITLLEVAEVQQFFNFEPQLHFSAPLYEINKIMRKTRHARSFHYHDFNAFGPLKDIGCSKAVYPASEFCDNLSEARFRAYQALGDHPFLEQFGRTFSNAAKYSYAFDYHSIFSRVSTKPIFSELHLPPECQIVELAVRKNQRQLLVNETYYVILTDLEKALFWMHETFHSWFEPQKDSLAVRQALWYLAGNNEFRQKNLKIFKKLIEEKTPQDFVESSQTTKDSQN